MWLDVSLGHASRRVRGRIVQGKHDLGVSGDIFRVDPRHSQIGPDTQ